MHLTRYLNLDKRIKLSFFQCWVNIGLPKVISILIEVKSSSIHIKKDTYHCPSCENPELWRVLWVVFVNVIVRFPTFVPEFISRLEVNAPNIMLSGQVLIYLKIFSANSNAYPRLSVAFWDSVDSVLEIVFVVLLFQRNGVCYTLIRLFCKDVSHVI